MCQQAHACHSLASCLSIVWVLRGIMNMGRLRSVVGYHCLPAVFVSYSQSLLPPSQGLLTWLKSLNCWRTLLNTLHGGIQVPKHCGVFILLMFQRWFLQCRGARAHSLAIPLPPHLSAVTSLDKSWTAVIKSPNVFEGDCVDVTASQCNFGVHDTLDTTPPPADFLARRRGIVTTVKMHDYQQPTEERPNTSKTSGFGSCDLGLNLARAASSKGMFLAACTTEGGQLGSCCSQWRKCKGLHCCLHNIGQFCPFE